MTDQVSMPKNYRKNQQPDVFSTIILGFFKALWWIVRLPFKGIKLGVGKTGLSLNDRNYIATKRQQIEGMLQSQNEIELRHTLMEADKLVDYTLKAQGYAGETFADRLRSAQSSTNPAIYNEVWQGHKVRNQIAHEHEARITNHDLKEATGKLLNYLKIV